MTTESADDVTVALEEIRARLSALEAARGVSPPAPGTTGIAASSSTATQRDLEGAVDQMVAGALLRGRRTAGVLNGMFNLSPGLSGR